MRFEQYDLPAMIGDLVRAGQKYEDIIAAMGRGMVCEATIRYWRQGGQPRLTPGLAFLRAWEAATGRSLDGAPRVPYVPMRRSVNGTIQQPPPRGKARTHDSCAAADELMHWPLRNAPPRP